MSNCVSGISINKELNINIYEAGYSNEGVTIYDGRTRSKVSTKTFIDMMSNPIKYGAILVSKSDYNEGDTMEEAYKRVIRLYYRAKLYTKGLINLRQTGTVKKTALKFFFDTMNRREHEYLNKGDKIVPETISTEEALIIKCATTNAMTWANEYQGKAYKYDVNSFYPSILSSKYFVVPVGAPIKRKLSQKEFDEVKYYSIGLYHVKITHTTEQQKKLFQINKSHWYTHYEVAFARELNMNMSIIESGETNYLQYERSKCKLGSEVFGRYVGVLYNTLKKNHDDELKRLGKMLLARLWGSLYEKEKITVSQEENPSFDDRIILSCVMLPNGKTRVEFAKKEKLFKYDWARVAPFLLGKGKVEIAKRFMKYADNILRVHTDGFMSNEPLPFKLDKELGGLKLEKEYKQILITNYMQTIDMEKIDTDRSEFNKFIAYHTKCVKDDEREIKQQRKLFL